MAVTKRTRYEVLKRDNHTCRYCGANQDDGPLTVDHVTPTALGGTDKPDNLVAACRDCNAGKSSTSPDAGVVEDVKLSDLKWSGALRRVAAARARQRKKRDAYVGSFATQWDSWKWNFGESIFPKPGGWRTSVERFYDVGLPLADLLDCVRVAMANDRISPDETFRYFAGCCWKTVTQIQEAAKELLDAEESADGP